MISFRPVSTEVVPAGKIYDQNHFSKSVNSVLDNSIRQLYIHPSCLSFLQLDAIFCCCCFVSNWFFFQFFFPSCCGPFLLHFQQEKNIWFLFFYLLQPTSLISVNHPFPNAVIFFFVSSHFYHLISKSFHDSLSTTRYLTVK